MTVCSPTGSTVKWCARYVEPAKNVPRMSPIHRRTVAAFFDSGGRNSGTPLEMASTPVRAEHPDANARNKSQVVTAVWVVALQARGSGHVPNGCTRHQRIISPKPRMKE